MSQPNIAASGEPAVCYTIPGARGALHDVRPNQFQPGSSGVERGAHNALVAGSTPAPATITSQMNNLRARAAFFTNVRRKDVALYDVLGDCLALCERVLAEGGIAELKTEATAPAKGHNRNRRYFEATADVYLVVGRLVFEGPDRRSDACWRYTATLREAVQRGIAGADLGQWLRTHGGINALFRARPVTARTAKTKTLHLNEQINVPKDGAFTITLQRMDNGFFSVIAPPVTA